MRRRRFIGLSVGAAVAWVVGPWPVAAQSPPSPGVPDPASPTEPQREVSGGLPAIVRFAGNADPIGAFIAPLSAPHH